MRAHHSVCVNTTLKNEKTALSLPANLGICFLKLFFSEERMWHSRMHCFKCTCKSFGAFPKPKATSSLWWKNNKLSDCAIFWETGKNSSKWAISSQKPHWVVGSHTQPGGWFWKTSRSCVRTAMRVFDLDRQDVGWRHQGPSPSGAVTGYNVSHRRLHAAKDREQCVHWLTCPGISEIATHCDIKK